VPAEAHQSIAYLLEESQRPGDYMPIEEDEHGTYVMNSKDLRAIEHVQRLVEIGELRSRLKAAPRARITWPALRRLIGQPLTTPWPVARSTPSCWASSKALANRGYTSGFFQRHTPEATQNYLRGYSESGSQSVRGRCAGV